MLHLYIRIYMHNYIPEFKCIGLPKPAPGHPGAPLLQRGSSSRRLRSATGALLRAATKAVGSEHRAWLLPPSYNSKIRGGEFHEQGAQNRT